MALKSLEIKDRLVLSLVSFVALFLNFYQQAYGMDPHGEENDGFLIHPRGTQAEKRYQEALNYQGQSPLEYYKKAAKLNHVEAQYVCGTLYEKEDNDRKALKWYLRAAEQNHPQANEWFNHNPEAAAVRNEIKGLFERAKSYHNEGNYHEARYWFFWAKERNYPKLGNWNFKNDFYLAEEGKKEWGLYLPSDDICQGGSLIAPKSRDRAFTQDLWTSTM